MGRKAGLICAVPDSAEGVVAVVDRGPGRRDCDVFRM
jgi:hypothetical protein